MRRLLLTLLLCATLCAGATGRYESLRVRADRSYGWREWASAAAMYELMLDICPDSARTYSRAIVATCLVPDTVAGPDLLQRAMAHGIALDDVLRRVRAESYDIGEPALYGSLLQRLQTVMPWMSRAIDHELLRHYLERGDGPNTVRYARVMLDGLPDSREFLSALARGYLTQDMTEEAADVWRRILELYPDDYETLLYLANYHILGGRPDEARPYITRARQIRDTPALRQLDTEP